MTCLLNISYILNNVIPNKIHYNINSKITKRRIIFSPRFEKNYSAYEQHLRNRTSTKFEIK